MRMTGRTFLTAATVLASVLLVTPPASATTRATAIELPSLGELRGARLTLADLPGSYVRDRSRDSGSSSVSSSNDPACSRRLAELNDNDNGGAAPRKAESKFRAEKTVGPFVESSVSAWRTKAPAVEGFRNLRALLRVCDRWTETSPDGSVSTVWLTRLPLPRLGSERLAFRVRITVREGALAITARADFAAVRVRNTVTLVSVVSFGPAGAVRLADLARLSTDRLGAVV